MDPFYKDNTALSEFWYFLSMPRTMATNQKLRINHNIRNDGKAPFFIAQLDGNRKVVFKTEGMLASDVIITLNRLLGNPLVGKMGKMPVDNATYAKQWQVPEKTRIGGK